MHSENLKLGVFYVMLPHVKLMMSVLKEERRCMDVNGRTKNLVTSFQHWHKAYLFHALLFYIVNTFLHT